MPKRNRKSIGTMATAEDDTSRCGRREEGRSSEKLDEFCETICDKMADLMTLKLADMEERMLSKFQKASVPSHFSADSPETNTNRNRSHPGGDSRAEAMTPASRHLNRPAHPASADSFFRSQRYFPDSEMPFSRKFPQNTNYAFNPNVPPFAPSSMVSSGQDRHAGFAQNRFTVPSHPSTSEFSNSSGGVGNAIGSNLNGARSHTESHPVRDLTAQRLRAKDFPRSDSPHPNSRDQSQDTKDASIGSANPNETSRDRDASQHMDQSRERYPGQFTRNKSSDSNSQRQSNGHSPNYGGYNNTRSHENSAERNVSGNGQTLNRKHPTKDADEWIVKLARDASVSQDGCLYKYVGSLVKLWESESKFWRLWVPACLTQRIIAYIHLETVAGHMGVRKTYKRIEERTSPAIRSPWENVACDLLGPYLRGRKGFKYLLVVTCYATKYVELFGLRAATAASIIKKLWLVFLKWGFSQSITTDNGSQFSSKRFLNWCESIGVRSWRIASYHPQSNPYERYNRTVKERIVSQIEVCKDWDSRLDEVAFAINSSVNDSTGFSPAYLNFGQKQRTPMDNTLKLDLSGIERDEIDTRMQLVHNLAKENTIVSQKTYMGNYNKDKIQANYKEGDTVYTVALNISNASKGITSSLCKKYAGPFIISKMISHNISELKCPKTAKIIGRVHVSRLKPAQVICT
ncbi:unnamed protein product [Allacma fusca]|uniref:Integrase catalytic domain-containing protein n=1 Tax=Allacma fusca TaxID=39272 RepID=A0A8J2KM72_9HEXA|nr:unnamed protein product [Allacma fusca]